jgi:Ca2+/Na+ antiporter
MKKKKNNLWIIVAIVAIILILGYLFFRYRKNKAQKEDLETKIDKQQGFVTYLLLEFEHLKQIQDKLICDAVKLYKRVRIFAVTAVVAFGFVCYGFYSLPFWASITGLLAFLAFVYYCYTLIEFNKFLDYNIALKKVENYFIIRQYRKNDFVSLINYFVINAITEVVNNKLQFENMFYYLKLFINKQINQLILQKGEKNKNLLSLLFQMRDEMAYFH